jgi:protein-tyrosine-phosphatase
MVIHFICRGNAFRSIIAEAYMNSLKKPDVTVISSGTVASENKENNSDNFLKTLALLDKHGITQYAKDHHGDNLSQGLLDRSEIVICMNRLVYEEANCLFKLPPDTHIWDITDLGEGDRIPTTEAEREVLSEGIYSEIAKNIDDFVKAKVSKK